MELERQNRASANASVVNSSSTGTRTDADADADAKSKANPKQILHRVWIQGTVVAASDIDTTNGKADNPLSMLIDDGTATLKVTGNMNMILYEHFTVCENISGDYLSRVKGNLLTNSCTSFL